VSILDEFYPGSRERRDQPAAPAFGVEEEDPLGTGTVMIVRGRQIEFFYVGQVARAIGRSSVTLRAWEASNVIPKSGYIKPGKDARGRRRLYTRAQAEAIIRLAKIHGVIDPGSRKPLTDFKHAVWAAFAELKGAR
jgi:hypothetical protein